MSIQAKEEKSQSATQPVQIPRGMSAMLSRTVFPGRISLMILEVAKVLCITDKHVVSLINEGLLGAVEITGNHNKSSRAHWRIPVGAYDDYIIRRHSSSERTPSSAGAAMVVQRETGPAKQRRRKR